MTQHRIHDIYHVKRLLGHKSILNTELYMHLEKVMFETANDDFYVRTAGTVKEVKKLLEAGFEYVTDMDGLKLFRKRK